MNIHCKYIRIVLLLKISLMVYQHPEGVHRDGVSYIIITMVERKNINGGLSTIYDSNKNEIGKVTLNNPLDTIMANDEKVFHGTTSIQIDKLGQEAHRDVLVVAFTKE